MEVLTHPDSYWDGLDYALVFDRKLKRDEKKLIERVVRAWYDVGLFGGFGGVLHDLSSLEWILSGEADRLEWFVDMGSTTSVAVDTLVACLDRASQDSGIPIRALELGTAR